MQNCPSYRGITVSDINSKLRRDATLPSTIDAQERTTRSFAESIGRLSFLERENRFDLVSSAGYFEFSRAVFAPPFFPRFSYEFTTLAIFHVRGKRSGPFEVVGRFEGGDWKDFVDQRARRATHPRIWRRNRVRGAGGR